MNMSEIDVLINQVKDRDDVHIGVSGPQEEATVFMLEAALGISLPPSYRTFVKCYGYMGWSDSDVMGIDGISQLDSGAYAATIQARADFGLAAFYIVIRLGADPDEIVCLDSSKSDEEGEYPVVGYDSQYNDTWPLANNFGLYLKSQLTNLIENL